MAWLISRAMVKASESSPSSPEAEAEYSAAIFLAGGRYAPSSEKPTRHQFWSRGKMTVRCPFSRCGTTLRPLTETHGEALLTSFLEAFPARTSAQQAGALASPGQSPASGESSHESSERFARRLFSWRKARCSGLAALESSLATLPNWGSMRSGVVFQREAVALPTSEIGCGLSVPMPTVCGNYNRKGASAKSGDGLATFVRMFPTPTVQDAHNNGGESQSQRNTVPLNALAGGKLNPTWTEWLMGFPLGWTDLDPLETDRFQSWQQQHGAS